MTMAAQEDKLIRFACGVEEGMVRDSFGNWVDYSQAADTIARLRAKLAATQDDLEILGVCVRTGCTPPDRKWTNDTFHKTSLRACAQHSELSALRKGELVCVPKDPSYEMCKAFGGDWEGNFAGTPSFPERYKAMLAAGQEPK